MGSIAWRIDPVDHDPFGGDPRKGDSTTLDLLLEDDKLRRAAEVRAAEAQKRKEEAETEKSAITDSDPAPALATPPQGMAVLNAFSDPKVWENFARYADSLPRDDTKVWEGGVLPISQNDKGEVSFDSNAGLVGSIKRALSLPGDVATGKVDPLSEEGISRATEMAANLGMGGSVLPKPEGSIGIFGGMGAKKIDWNKVNKVSELGIAGANPVDIFKQTGWFLDKDNKWKFEIGDFAADFHPNIDHSKIDPKAYYRLGDVFDHPALFDQYPGAANLNVRFDKEGTGFNGMFSPNTSTIHLDPSMPLAKQRSTMLHELQHYVQLHEGFAYGGSPQTIPAHVQDLLAQVTPDWQELLEKQQRYERSIKGMVGKALPGWFDKLNALSEPERKRWERMQKVFADLNTVNQRYYDDYHRLAGEVEARNVQARADMTPLYRAATHPEFTADRTPGEQIVRFPNGTSLDAGALEAPQGLLPHPDWHPDATRHLLDEKRWFDNAEGPSSSNSQFLAKMLTDGPRGLYEPGAQGHFDDALRVHHSAAGPDGLPSAVLPFVRELHRTAELVGDHWVAPTPDNQNLPGRMLDILDHAGYKQKGDGWHFPLSYTPPKPEDLSPLLAERYQRGNVSEQKEGMRTTPESRLSSTLSSHPELAENPRHLGELTHFLARADMDMPEFHSAMSGGMHGGEMNVLPTGEPGQTEFFFSLKNPAGESIGGVNRVLDKYVAHHEMFEVNPEQQGAGVARKLLASQIELYKKMGIGEVRMFANIDVGGYAWAKYGFAPNEAGWRALRTQKIPGRLARVEDQLTGHDIDLVQKLVESRDPTSIWELSDLTTPVEAHAPTNEGFAAEKTTMPLGKFLLLGSGWHGTLRLSDKLAMERFHDYIGRKPSGGGRE